MMIVIGGAHFPAMYSRGSADRSRLLVLSVFLAVACVLARSQVLTINVSQPGSPRESVTWVNGYRSSVAGQTISYHSSHPDADNALLCRVRRDADSIAWETDTLTRPSSDECYHLVWLAGIERIGWGNATHPHTFQFSVNGQRWFTFTNRKDSSAPKWTISANSGARLSFESRMVDRYGDLFGYMFLDI